MDHLRRKLSAAEEFKRRLLESKFGERLVKLVLFGSVSRGEADRDSDVDLMAFMTDVDGGVEELMDEISFDIWLEMGERIEKVVLPLEEIRHPTSWLVYRSLATGVEMYSLSEEELKEKEQRGYAQLSGYFIRAAEASMADGFFRASVDLAYNAAELAVRGLLLFKMDDLPSTHGGIVNRFGDLFVRTGEVEAELGRKLTLALEARNRARYVIGVEVGREDAEEAIDLARKLMALLESRL